MKKGNKTEFTRYLSYTRISKHVAIAKYTHKGVWYSYTLHNGKIYEEIQRILECGNLIVCHKACLLHFLALLYKSHY